ncbi:MAG: phytanoyl-CoA dioxygenase family protein [Pirellulales bacterium]
MQLKLGTQFVEPEGRYLTLDLLDSSDAVNEPAVLRRRLEEDGYLLIRGFHDPDAVLAARRDILETLAEQGKLDPQAPLMDGVVNPNTTPDTISVRGREALKTQSLKSVVRAPRTMQFFDRFFGEASVSFNFQWLRTAGPGAASPVHCDMVYMGRGTKELCTLWTPFGRVTPDMGSLAICLGSHRWQEIIDTYGQDDVDHNVTPGIFTHDPAELVDRFGGRWATTTFEPGDAIIVSMHLLHASLGNLTNRYRISCDTRYQRASQPQDERWSGEAPQGHPVMWSPGVQLETVEVSRKRWGI